MSLDGFVAGPNDSPENSLGDGGDRLFKWYFSGGATHGDRHCQHADGSAAGNRPADQLFRIQREIRLAGGSRNGTRNCRGGDFVPRIAFSKKQNSPTIFRRAVLYRGF